MARAAIPTPIGGPSPTDADLFASVFVPFGSVLNVFLGPMSFAFPPPPPPRTLASIDIGSGSVLLLIVEADGRGGSVYEVREEMCLVTGLGRGKAPDGRLHPDSVERTFDALRHYARRMMDMGVDAYRCIGTSALRDSPERGLFEERARQELDLSIEVVSGTEEARLTFLAQHHAFGKRAGKGKHSLLVVDIGAGSTEFVWGQGGKIQQAHSLNLGSVRHSEGFLKKDPPSAEERRALQTCLDEALATLPDAPAGEFTLVGVAGTVTTLLAVRDGLNPYDGEKVHGQVFSSDELDIVTDRIFSLPLERRRLLAGIHPGRADVLPAGAEILRASLRRFGVSSLVVSDRGVRFGALYDRWPGATIR